MPPAEPIEPPRLHLQPNVVGSFIRLALALQQVDAEESEAEQPEDPAGGTSAGDE